MSVGIWQILIVVLLVALLFGRRIGGAGQALGRGVREATQAVSEAVGKPKRDESKASSEREGATEQTAPDAAKALGTLAKLWFKLRGFPFSLFK